MSQPNNPCPTCGEYNNTVCSNSYHLWVEPEIEIDSLHVGEMVGEAAIDSLIMDEYDTERPYTSGFIRGANWMKDKLSEAGESKWIDVKNNLPEVAGFYWVNRIVVDTHTDDHGNAQFINEQEKIFYFKERNVTGWEKDWTANPSNVTHWQPLPSAPNETNVAPRLYTHAELLAFGEKVKELAAEQGTIIYIESETKDGIIDAEIDKQSILSIDLNELAK
jgi:hypothetical protein